MKFSINDIFSICDQIRITFESTLFSKQIIAEVEPSTVIYLKLKTSEIRKLSHSLNFKQIT